MNFIQMVAYHQAHHTGDAPWRCVVCDKLTAISEENLFSHMAQVHGWGKAMLRQEGDALFLYPPVEGVGKEFN
jgi:hypothetical protein